MLNEYFSSLRAEAIGVYHVDPLIFIIIYVITIPVYYLGLFIMVEQGIICYKADKKRAKKFHLNELFSHKGFIIGLLILIIGWIAPYIYVILYGDNIPLIAYVVVFGFFFLSIYLVVKKAHIKIVGRILGTGKGQKVAE